MEDIITKYTIEVDTDSLTSLKETLSSLDLPASVQAELLQGDGGLAAIGRGPGVKGDHAPGLPAGSLERVAQKWNRFCAQNALKILSLEHDAVR